MIDQMRELFQKRTDKNREERIEEHMRKKREVDEVHDKFDQTYTDLNTVLDDIKKRHG